MDHPEHLHTGTAGPEVCVACGRPFVVPVALLDIIDEGLFLVALHCMNCDRLAVGVHEDAELERLEANFDRAAGEIRAAIDVAEVASLVDELGDVRRALEPGARRPEDR